MLVSFLFFSFLSFSFLFFSFLFFSTNRAVPSPDPPAFNSYKIPLYRTNAHHSSKKVSDKATHAWAGVVLVPRSLSLRSHFPCFRFVSRPTVPSHHAHTIPSFLCTRVPVTTTLCGGRTISPSVRLDLDGLDLVGDAEVGVRLAPHLVHRHLLRGFGVILGCVSERVGGRIGIQSRASASAPIATRSHKQRNICSRMYLGEELREHELALGLVHVEHAL